MRVRQLSVCVVIQMWLILPAPSMFARSKVSPALTSTLGEIFQPGPRSRAQEAPVPSVARPPPPGAPSKFSGEIERVCNPRRPEIDDRSGGKGLAGIWVHILVSARRMTAYFWNRFQHCIVA